MNVSVIQHLLSRSLAGEISFPDVVKGFLQEGVESYQTDLVTCEQRFYTTDGMFHVESMNVERGEVSNTFSASAIKAAIQASQQREITLKVFLQRAVEAGISFYVVFLTGKKVIYFGRNGDFHIEPFPQAKV